MFPIIPQHLSSPGRNFSDSNLIFGNQSLNFQIRNETSEHQSVGGVSATCDIPNFVKSAPFQLTEKILPGNISSDHYKLNFIDGKLSSEKSDISLQTLLQNIRLADDCHSFNVQLNIANSERNLCSEYFVLETVKPLSTGQQLLLWFSEEILALLQMAFLTPANIQGQKRYVCHKCLKHFEYPNPLKIHLTLDCTNSPSHLWRRLRKTFNTLPQTSTDTTSPLNLSKSSINFKFELQTNTSNKNRHSIKTNEPTISKEIASETIEINTRRRSCDESTNIVPSQITRPLSEPSRLYSSAFHPYPMKMRQNYVQNNNSIPLPQSLPSQYPNHNKLLLPATAPHFNFNYSHATQMETLVSNLGKSKQGHLCIYCGKVYSRKYGLKIHIRTHTGFKPLKCKYCLRPFGDPSNLNKHVRLHAEGETPYKCELCGKVLVRRRDLERHLKSRHMLNVNADQLAERTEQLSVHEEDNN